MVQIRCPKHMDVGVFSQNEPWPTRGFQGSYCTCWAGVCRTAFKTALTAITYVFSGNIVSCSPTPNFMLFWYLWKGLQIISKDEDKPRRSSIDKIKSPMLSMSHSSNSSFWCDLKESSPVIQSKIYQELIMYIWQKSVWASDWYSIYHHFPVVF